MALSKFLVQMRSGLWLTYSDVTSGNDDIAYFAAGVARLEYFIVLVEVTS